MDVECEETQPELDVKPARHRQKKGKEDNETPGDQRRRGMASKEKLDTQASSVGNISPCGILLDARSNVFAPYIHVEKRLQRSGLSVQSLMQMMKNLKVEAKLVPRRVDSPLNTPLSSQPMRKEKENERTKENWVAEPV